MYADHIVASLAPLGGKPTPRISLPFVPTASPRPKPKGLCPASRTTAPAVDALCVFPPQRSEITEEADRPAAG